MWIGLVYLGVADDWRWDGVSSNVTYFNWGEWDPNNYLDYIANNTATHVCVRAARLSVRPNISQWYDMYCHREYRYICEKGKLDQGSKDLCDFPCVSFS